MVSFHIMDATALLSVESCCKPSRLPELLLRLDDLMDENVLRIPKAVVKELDILGRGESVTFWALGMNRTLNKFAATVDDKLAVMQIFQLEMGYDSGLEDIDGSDPTIIELAAIGYMLQSLNHEFRIVSEDQGSTPLRPTMEEVCAYCGWTMLNTRDGLKSMGLEEYLTQ